MSLSLPTLTRACSTPRAMAAVRTRVYLPRIPGDVSAFIPIADLMNHKNGYSTLGFDAAEQVVTSFKHIAEVDYAPGDELFASYSNGNACNQHLLYVRCAVRRGAICSRRASPHSCRYHYGFTLADPTADCVVVTMSVNANIMQYATAIAVYVCTPTQQQAC